VREEFLVLVVDGLVSIALLRQVLGGEGETVGATPGGRGLLQIECGEGRLGEEREGRRTCTGHLVILFLRGGGGRKRQVKV